MISAVLVDMVELTAEGLVFKAPRHRAPAARTSAARTSKARRPRAPTPAEATLEGAEFEEGGVDWEVLAVVWDATLEDVARWYYGVAMAAEGELTEGELSLSRKESFDIGLLGCPSVREVVSWIKAPLGPRKRSS